MVEVQPNFLFFKTENFVNSLVVIARANAYAHAQRCIHRTVDLVSVNCCDYITVNNTSEKMNVIRVNDTNFIDMLFFYIYLSNSGDRKREEKKIRAPCKYNFIAFTFMMSKFVYRLMKIVATFSGRNFFFCFIAASYRPICTKTILKVVYFRCGNHCTNYRHECQ